MTNGECIYHKTVDYMHQGWKWAFNNFETDSFMLLSYCRALKCPLSPKKLLSPYQKFI